jgi:hypothetical protein
MATALRIEFDKLYPYVCLRAYVQEVKFFPDSAPYMDIMANRLGVPCSDLEAYLQKHAFGSIVSRRPSWETPQGRIAALYAEAMSVGR